MEKWAKITFLLAVLGSGTLTFGYSAHANPLARLHCALALSGSDEKRIDVTAPVFALTHDQLPETPTDEALPLELSGFIAGQRLVVLSETSAIQKRVAKLRRHRKQDHSQEIQNLEEAVAQIQSQWALDRAWLIHQYNLLANRQEFDVEAETKSLARTLAETDCLLQSVRGPSPQRDQELLNKTDIVDRLRLKRRQILARLQLLSVLQVEKEGNSFLKKSLFCTFSSFLICTTAAVAASEPAISSAFHAGAIFWLATTPMAAITSLGLKMYAVPRAMARLNALAQAAYEDAYPKALPAASTEER